MHRYPVRIIRQYAGDVMHAEKGKIKRKTGDMSSLSVSYSHSIYNIYTELSTMSVPGTDPMSILIPTQILLTSLRRRRHLLLRSIPRTATRRRLRIRLLRRMRIIRFTTWCGALRFWPGAALCVLGLLGCGCRRAASLVGLGV